MPSIQNADIRVTPLPRALLRGLIVSVSVTVVALIILSLIITYTPLSEAFADIAVAVLTYIAVTAGSFSAARGTSGRGWLTGILSASVYILLMWLISTLIQGDMHTDSSNIVHIIISIICGAFGGIVGINVS